MEPFRILIATHDSKLRNTLRLGLQLAGYLVGEAADGRQALTIAQDEPPDVALLDLTIPNVGSIALLAEFATMSPRLRPRTIVLADPLQTSLAIEALTLGASDFLQKPITVEDARASIASVLREPLDEQWNSTTEQVDELAAIRVALEMGRFGSIEPTLLPSGPIAESTALNIAGVVHEAHGRINHAMQFYRRAIDCDPDYWPAVENLKRLVEFQDCGETSRGVFFREAAHRGESAVATHA